MENRGNSPLNLVLTATEVASMYGLDTSVVRRACLAGAVEARHAGRVWLITRASAEARWGKGRQGRQRAPHFRAVIHVANGHAYVAKLEGQRTVIASNWQELEADAAEAVGAQGGFVTLSGIYPCPPELARRAKWPSHGKE